jgi:hypothetical protein
MSARPQDLTKIGCERILSHVQTLPTGSHERRSFLLLARPGSPIGGKGVSRRDAIIDFDQRGRVNVFGVLSAGLRGHEQSSVNVRLSVRDPS